jgi:hypothetical protein
VPAKVAAVVLGESMCGPPPDLSIALECAVEPSVNHQLRRLPRKVLPDGDVAAEGCLVRGIGGLDTQSCSVSWLTVTGMTISSCRWQSRAITREGGERDSIRSRLRTSGVTLRTANLAFVA